MPALYAHNKFGKLVIPKLPNQTKKIIKKYPDAFRIGLQGPDFLFFDIFQRKITKLGVNMHHTDAYSFMSQATKIIQKYGINSAQYSYIAGFICHFALDTACHPLVHKFMKDTNCGHVEIEGDLEHLILTKDGHHAVCYPMERLVPNSRTVAVYMAPFYPQLSVDEIYHCLCMMRYIKKFFVSPQKFKRIIIAFAMKCSLHYKRLKGHVITPYPNRKCRTQSELLYKQLILSIDDAVRLIDDFTLSTFNNTNLSENFHKDFNGV